MRYFFVFLTHQSSLAVATSLNDKNPVTLNQVLPFDITSLGVSTTSSVLLLFDKTKTGNSQSKRDA